jgi:hypothetical protein
LKQNAAKLRFSETLGKFGPSMPRTRRFAACWSAALVLLASSPLAKPAAYVAKPPARETQVSKSAAERGVNPCNTPDPGFGIYGGWSRGIAMGQLLLPERGGVAKNGDFDVMFHFHGHEPARKEWVQVMDGAVLVGIDLGLGSGPYESAFAAPEAFQKLVESVERKVSSKIGRPAKARKIGLSAWSAGYGAVQQILGQRFGKARVDSVILLDGLHCGYEGRSLNRRQLQAFIEFAGEAASGRKFMFVSHSSIIPPGYASTTETAEFLVHELGGRARAVAGKGPLGLDLIARFSRGNFHMRGFSGNDKLDHCAHLGLFRDVLAVHIKPRWNSPRGRAS